MVEALQEGRAPPRAVRLPQSWPLILGAAVLGAASVVSLGKQVWSQEYGAHGPILLAASAWLLWQQKAQLEADAKPGNLLAVFALTLLSLASYVFGKAYDYITLEAAGLYGVIVAFLYSRFGARALVRQWFPLLYLAFLIPPPLWALDHLTSPLKHLVSYVSVEGLSHLGYPVSRQGVALFIAQYQLLVEDACSGMNSLVGLTAVSLLYIYLMHGSRPFYSLVLIAAVVPIAVAANILRIVLLMLMTYYFGDAVAQGVAHFTTGIFLFAIALGMVFLCDTLLSRFLPKKAQA